MHNSPVKIEFMLDLPINLTKTYTYSKIKIETVYA